MEWINVKDKMPPHSGSVIVYTQSNEIHVGENKGTFWVVGGRFSFDMGEPTHWMPLPYPPKEEAKEQ